MKTDRKSSHSPGAQGHGDMLPQLSKLERTHGSMMGNQHNPDHDERVGQKPLTERLYQEQAPKDYKDRDITKHRQGNNESDIHEWPPNAKRRKPRRRRGDVGGLEY